jgi:hypothetical protein
MTSVGTMASMAGVARVWAAVIVAAVVVAAVILAAVILAAVVTTMIQAGGTLGQTGDGQRDGGSQAEQGDGERSSHDVGLE